MAAGRRHDSQLSVVERVELLRTVEFFGGTPGRILAAVADEAEEVVVADGETLIRRGEDGSDLYVVVSGRFGVDVGDRRVNELGPGDVVGELAVLVPEPRAATVTALGEGLVLLIRKVVMDELLLDHPDVAVGIIRSLVRRFQHQSATADGVQA